MKQIDPADTLSVLTANIKAKLVENHILANVFNRNFNQNSIEIGQWLMQAKKLVPHGQFSAWLDENFSMTERTAQNYMKVAKYFGVNSALKNENVFVFQPAALIELTKLPVENVKIFLESQASAGVDISKLSVRQLRDAIKKFKPVKPSTPREKTVTIEMKDDRQLALFDLPKLPTLPAPTFLIPAVLAESADRAGLTISLDFSRNVKPASTEILITKQTVPTLQKLSLVAEAVIFCAPLLFSRTDETASRFKICIWYFGNEVEKFFRYFETFGVSFLPRRRSITMAGEKLKMH